VIRFRAATRVSERVQKIEEHIKNNKESTEILEDNGSTVAPAQTYVTELAKTTRKKKRD
jgi:hypothetical protein